MDLINKLSEWVDAPKMVGFFFAVGTLSYIFVVTTRHHKEFWEGIKGDDGKLQFIEAALTIWLTLFTGMAVADFAFGLVASDKLWWSMDTIFLIGVGGRTMSVMNRSGGGMTKEPIKKDGGDEITNQ